MKPRYLLPLAGMLLPFVTPVANAETPTELVVDVYAKPKSPKISVYGRPTDQIAQSTAHIKGKDAAKTGSDRLEDFVDYVPGVLSTYGSGVGSNISIRGFGISKDIQLDGMRDVQDFYLRDPATLDSVEITKGLDSVLFGSGLPGGSVNYVSKKPSAKQKRTLSILTGTPAQLRSILDINGPLGTANWAGRLLVSGQKANSGYANIGDDRFTVMPSLRWHDANQSLLLSAEYGWQNRENDSTTLFYRGAPIYNVSYVDPRATAERRIARIALDYTRQLGENWEASVQASHIDAKQREKQISFAMLSDSGNTLDGYYRKQKLDHTQKAMRAEITHTRETAHSQQQTRLGFSSQETESALQSGDISGTFTLDLYQPSFDFPLPDDSLPDNSVFQAHWPERAWYLQHQTKLNEKLGISAGVRASHTTFDGAIPSLSRRTLDARDTSTSLGLTWQATPTWQWFASHNESFSPNLGWDRSGNLFAPEQSVQHETGIRYTQESLAGRPLQANLSTYRIDRKNVTTADPVNPAYSVLTGAMRSEGIEATLETPLTPKLNLSAGYNYGDVRITESNSGLKGNRLHNTPRHSGSLQLTYASSATSELSLGAVHVGKRPGDNANSFEVPAYTRLDAAAQWKLDKHTTLTAGVRNLLDEDYIAASAASNSLVQGRKRSVTLGLEVAF